MLIPSLFKKYQRTFIIATIFAFSIFAQSVLFHYLIYHEILFSSLWTHTEDFIRFYLPHTSIALFLAGFVFLFRNKWWTVAVSVFINVWILANLWYYRTNGIMVDQYAFQMIGNLNGFLDSIIALIRPADFAFIGLTIILTICIIVTKDKEKNIKISITLIVLGVFLGFTNGLLLVRKHSGDISYLNPLKKIVHHYVEDYSVIHLLVLTTKEYLMLNNEEKYILTEQEESKINNFLNLSTTSIKSNKTLILCIIESLNSFVITKEIMPNLQSFIDTSNHVLYCNKMTSQIKSGGSSDGQLIIISGLLPLENGAACYRFCFNNYPTISHVYDSSLIILPHAKHVYNQGRMNSAYGITNCFEKQSDNDKELFKITIQQSNYYNMVMMLTISTHMPYTSYADSSHIDISNTIPKTLQNYIKSVNVLDQGMAKLFDAISSDEHLKNATIVITSDHRMPVPSNENFDNAYNYSRFIPLFIYSPEIKQKTLVTDTCYQMDIYPTILHLIGCEDYYWKGFGVNLLDSTARHNRPITPEEAYDLSDKLIRADYFKNYDKQ